MLASERIALTSSSSRPFSSARFSSAVRPAGLGRHADDLQVAQRRGQGVHHLRIDLLAGRKVFQVPFAAGVGPLQRRGLARLDRPPLQVNLVVVDDDLANLGRLEFQQVCLDPVGEPGRKLDVFQLHTINAVLAGDADEPLTRGTGDALAEDQVGEDLVGFVADRDALAQPIGAGDGLRIAGVEHAQGLVVLGLVGADRVLGQVDDSGGGPGEAVLGVGRVVVVRRDHPAPILKRDLEQSRLTGRLVEADDLQGRRLFGDGELGEELLPLVLERLRRSGGGPGGQHDGRQQHQREGGIDRGLLQLVHGALPVTHAQ